MSTASAPAFVHPSRRIVVALCGASGAVYGVRLLKALRELPGVEIHLTVSDAGWLNLKHELDLDREAVTALTHRLHDARDVGAAIASGSFQSCLLYTSDAADE